MRWPGRWRLRGARRLPRLLFIVDRPNWAHDYKTEALRRALGGEFQFLKRYQADVEADDLEAADLVVIYYWMQIERLSHLHAGLERAHRKLLIGICGNVDLNEERRETGLSVLRRWPRAVFTVNRALY